MNFLTFNIAEGTHTLQHFIKVHLVSVKFRTINTYKLGLSANSDTAGTAHTGTVNHDCIQRHFCRNLILLGQQTNKLHHNGRTNGKTFVHLFALDNFFHTFRYQSFLAIRSVISHNNYLIRTFTHFLLQDNQFLGTSGQYSDHTISCSLQCLHNRQHRSYTYTTSGTNYRTEIVNMRCFSQRAYHIRNIITLIQFT